MATKMRILYEGTKNFSQRHVSLNIMIVKYDNCDECFEIIAYDIISWVEIPRVYINIWALNALISKRKIVDGSKTITSLSDIRIDEKEQVELLLTRLIIKSNTAVRVVELTFESFDHDRVCVRGKLVYLDMVQAKPPDLETYVLPNAQVLRAKTFDQILKEKEIAKKKEHDKALLNNVCKIFNKERHVEVRASKTTTEDDRALLQMQQIQFDLDFQLKPFDRELARARWLKAISRIMYSILYVKILNRLDVYQWFNRPKDSSGLDTNNLKYKSRASFTDDDYMYGSTHRKKDDPSDFRLSHRDDSCILESFSPIPHAKPFKAFNYGPYVSSTAASTPMNKAVGLSSLPSIALPHIGDVVRTLAPVLDHLEEEEKIVDKLGGTKQIGVHLYNAHHHKPEVVVPYHHEEHDYFPCNKFHPQHYNLYEETHIRCPEVKEEDKKEAEHKTEKEQEEEDDDDASPMSPRSPRFRLLPTLREAPAGMLPSITCDVSNGVGGSSNSARSGGSGFGSNNSSTHTTPSYASSRLHAAVGEGVLHKSPQHHVSPHHHSGEDGRRGSLGGVKLTPVMTADANAHHNSGGGSSNHHTPASERRHSVEHHPHHTSQDGKRLSPLHSSAAATDRHHNTVTSPSSISHGHSTHDSHTALPNINATTSKHNNHIHGLKLVKKVGSFKMTASEKHDLLVASVGSGGSGSGGGGGGSVADKPISPTRSNHLRVLKDLKVAHEHESSGATAAAATTAVGDDDEDWGINPEEE